MSSPVMLALAGLLATGLLTTVGVLLHRDLAQINEQLARSGHQPDLHRHLDQLRGDVQRLQDGHARALDARFRNVETAVTHLRQNNADVTRSVDSMLPWVRQWATEAEQR